VSKLVVGCGYLGARVARRWRDAGEEVFVTTRKPERFAELSREGFRPVLCDVLAPRELPRVDAVLFSVGFDRAAGATMRRVYVEGLAGVLAALPGRPRFVHVSSTGVYGQCDGSEVDETADTHPADESGQVVLEAERLLRERRPEAVVLRFAGIYGPGRLLRAASLLAGEPIAADPSTWLNLIHVEDGADVVVAAESRSSEGETYNVSDGTPVRRLDFYAELARLLGAPPPRFVQPAAGHDRADRRVLSGKLRGGLGVVLRYPDYACGLAASVNKE
jgi:nucleoside-diphosphate-sugar epimerase